jgi:acyl-CoA thioesterase FadM
MVLPRAVRAAYYEKSAASRLHQVAKSAEHVTRDELKATGSASASKGVDAFRHKTPMSVRIGHIDVFGHLNNVAVFRLLEQSRIEYAIDVGLVGWNELGLILARVDCSFRAQGFYLDMLTCGCKAVRIGRKSFSLRQEVWREDGALIADADTVLVALGPDKVTPAEVSADWRSKLSSWEGTAL